MRYSLGTLLILSALMPPLLAAAWLTASWVYENPATAAVLAVLAVAYLFAAFFAVNLSEP